MNGVVLQWGVNGRGECCGRPGRQNEYFKFKKIGLHSTDFKLLNKVQGNLINNCDFLKPSIYINLLASEFGV
jgi:hypothetical protein